MIAKSRKPWLSSYAPGVPEFIEPVTQTLCDMLDASAELYRKRPAIDFLGAITTYGELQDQVSRAANGLRRLGVAQGDRVALIMPNCPQYIVALFAVYRLGAIIVPHNPMLTEGELRRQLEDHGAKVVIAWDKVAHTAVALASHTAIQTVISVSIVSALPVNAQLYLRLPLPALRKRLLQTGVEGAVEGTISWADVAAFDPLDPAHPRPLLGDVAAIMYSGGTAGRPRGVMLSHSNLRANAMQGEAWMTDIAYGREVMLGILPIFHGYGLTLNVHLTFSIGGRLMLFPRYTDNDVLGSMRRARGTLIAAIPSIYSRLTAAARLHGVDLSSLRYGIAGAMSLPDEVTREWEKISGGTLVEGYGLTEASPIALTNPFNFARRMGSIGIPFPSTDIRIIDLTDPSVAVGPDEEGELYIRGPQVFVGYWKRPDQTRQALTYGGWLRTGDIVRMSKDGFVYLVDRLQEKITSGGFNVSPGEVEEIVERHPSVRSVAVVGLPLASGGDDVVAVIELHEGTELDAEAIIAHCRSNIVSFKVPRRVIAVDNLPRSAQGKILRRVVRDELLDAEAPTDSPDSDAPSQ